MPKDINLLPREFTQARKSQERKKSLNFFAYIFLGSCVFISSIVFLYHLMLTRSNLSLSAAIGTEEKKIKELKAIEEESVGLELKASALTDLLKIRKRYSFLLDTVSKSAPESLKINSLVSSVANDVQVSGVADSYAILSRFLINIIDPEMGGIIFSAADLNSVNLDERAGGARFLMTLYLKKDSLITDGPETNK